MMTSARFATLLSILLLALTACDKKKTEAAAAPAAPVPGPVKYTTGSPANAGDYDGTKAVSVPGSFGGTYIIVPKDCPTFSCGDVKSGGSIDNDKLKTTCPKGHFMLVQLKETAKAGTKTPMESIVHTEVATGSANGLVLSGAKANELEVLSAGTSLVARVSLKNDESFEGIVGATVCPKP
jgi:hypothetical protein